MSLPDKRQVAESFSRAATSYDAAASLQQEVGAALLEQLPDGAVNTWLDLGCGTGYFSQRLAQRYPHANGLALDLALGMLQQARRLAAPAHLLQGDAEALALRAHSCDLIYSSLALQWCGDFAQVLSEAQRVLRPQGVLAFTSLCQGSLVELKDSWRAVDEQVHVNSFRAASDYQRLCDAAGFSRVHLTLREHRQHFPDLKALTRSLKDIGAHNLNAGRPAGLTSPAKLRALQAAYQQKREENGLPLSYQVLYGVLIK